MPLSVITSDRFADHVTPPGHPERVERAEVMQLVASKWVKAGGTITAPREATDDELARVHDPDYIAQIRAVRGRAGMLDPDTFVSPDSDDVARLAAGGVLEAVDHVLNSRHRRALVMARPPGHHAEADRAMGFCLYNSIAVGAAAARAQGVSRVAVVDYDVHHGNGTQWMFYEDPSVLFVSSHQYPFYPGTGAGTEIGRGEGLGFTVNLPLEAGATDADYDLVYRNAVVPILRAFSPELLLISAGFDAHHRDPLASMRVTTDGYAGITARLIRAADELCHGRIVFVTEGGYDTSALAECLEAVIDLANAAVPREAGKRDGDPTRGEAAIAHVRHAHGTRWPGVIL
jgi:acetoin utilization deacetylase AcuC-like enzyme